jgi:hypothetical protein
MKFKSTRINHIWDNKQLVINKAYLVMEETKLKQKLNRKLLCPIEEHLPLLRNHQWVEGFHALYGKSIHFIQVSDIMNKYYLSEKEIFENLFVHDNAVLIDELVFKYRDLLEDEAYKEKMEQFN